MLAPFRLVTSGLADAREGSDRCVAGAGRQGQLTTVAALKRNAPPLARSARTAATSRIGPLLSHAQSQHAVNSSGTTTP